MIELAENRYGKSRVRLMKVTRHDHGHAGRDGADDGRCVRGARGVCARRERAGHGNVLQRVSRARGALTHSHLSRRLSNCEGCGVSAS